MTTFSSRIGYSFVPSCLVTLATLIFMVTLLTTTNEVLTEPEDYGIKPFFHIDRVVEPKPTQPKPEPVPDAESAPPRLTPQNPIDTDTAPLEHIAYSMETVDPSLGAPSTTDYIPLYVPQPRYPSRALKRGVEGYAVISFTIGTGGNAIEPTLLEEVPGGYGFGRAALQAAGKLKYSPKMADGIPVEVTGVRYKFTFKVSE